MILAEITKQFPSEHPNSIAIRQHLARLCTDFVNSGLADQKFVSELTSGLPQKFWSCISEALIADRLQGKTFGTRIARGKGPDFLLMAGSQRVWIEVVCPEPIDVAIDWLRPELNDGVGDFPYEEILLRWTSAIKAKAEILIGSVDGKQSGYLATGVVAAGDAYVIAVNGCRLRSGSYSAITGISQFPFAAEAVFPIGPYQLRIDRKTSKLVDQGHTYRPQLLNKNRAEVPTTTFLDPRFNPVSAIWAVDLNGYSAIGNKEPMIVVHNPNAKNPVPLGFLPADDEYIASINGDELELSKA